MHNPPALDYLYRLNSRTMSSVSGSLARAGAYVSQALQRVQSQRTQGGSLSTDEVSLGVHSDDERSSFGFGPNNLSVVDEEEDEVSDRSRAYRADEVRPRSQSPAARPTRRADAPERRRRSPDAPEDVRPRSLSPAARRTSSPPLGKPKEATADYTHMLFGKFHYKNNPERVKITEKRVLRANTVLRTMPKSERKHVNKIAKLFAAHYKDYKLSEEMDKQFKHVAGEGKTLSEYVKLTIFFQHRTADTILHNLKHIGVEDITLKECENLVAFVTPATRD
jgi:hypothetical protein